MKVEIWSDIICPFCYIGKRNFEKGLEQFNQKNDVEKIYRSYQLDPTAGKEPTADIHTLLAKKYNMSYEEAKAMNNRVTEQAREVGLEYNLDQAVHTNTFDAHRLSHLAKQQGKSVELMEQLMKAYFTDGLNVSDHEVLANLAEEAGLSREKALQVLEGEDYSDAVNEDISLSSQIGVQGVPFFVFNRKYAVSGAQPPEVFLEVLEKVFEEEQQEPKLKVINEKENKAEYCDDDSCGI
ncbi:DsbA family oxidoreductase [Bacillaceae bacterium W0354]